MSFFEAKEKICFQILDDRPQIPDHTLFAGAKLSSVSGDINKIEDKLRRHNAENRGIFFVVNFGGHEAKDITRINAQFMEIDDVPFEEQIRRIEAFDLEPSLIVKTQKSLHVYWLMKPGAKTESFRYIQRQLVAHFGADCQNINLNRVFRVPGFYHCKKDPVLVQCVKFNPELRYTQEELSALLPEVEPDPETKVDGAPIADKGTQKGVALVGQRCPFIQHCKRNAAKLSEPDWYAMITNLAVFEGGVCTIHALSRPYPKYSEAATNAKISHFFTSGTKPQTCARICGQNGFDCPKYRDKSCPAKAPAGLAFFPADAAELAKFLKAAMFKSKGDAAVDIETAHKFINMFMFNIPPAKAEVFINHNIKDHYRLSAKDIKPLPGFQRQLYSVFSVNAEARKVRQRDNVQEWYDTTNRGTLKYLPGIHAAHLAENVKAIYVGNDYYFYEDGYYAKRSERRAQKYVLSEMIPRYATKNDILDTEFQWALLIDKYSREINTNPYLINLGNCIFNIQTWKTQPHDPNILSTIRIGGNYDESAKRPLTKVVFTDDSYDPSTPPEYIDKMIYRRSEHVTTPKDIYENTVRFLEPSGCLYLIPDMMIMDFAIAKYYLLLAQQEMTYSTIVGKNVKTDDIEITEYTEAMIKLQKNVLATWAPIWETVSRNSERVIDNPENDAMQFMFGGRKRKGAAKGGSGNGANAN